jgi:hypothetical protein
MKPRPIDRGDAKRKGQTETIAVNETAKLPIALTVRTPPRSHPPPIVTFNAERPADRCGCVPHGVCWNCSVKGFNEAAMYQSR